MVFWINVGGEVFAVSLTET